MKPPQDDEPASHEPSHSEGTKDQGLNSGAQPPPAESVSVAHDFGDTKNPSASSSLTPPSGSKSDPFPADPDSEGFSPWSFGRYELLELVGRGGMGDVYKVENTLIELAGGASEVVKRVEALKMISARCPATRAFRDLFLQEMHALAQLRHPHIIELYGAGEIKGQLYFTMPLEAGDLKKQALRQVCWLA